MNEFEQEMFDAINRSYSLPEWVTLPQVRIGTGYGKTYGGDRTIDALVINMYPSKEYRTIAIEIKKSLNDLTADIADPLKHAAIRFYTDEFYYAFDYEFYRKHEDQIYRKVLGESKAGIMLMRHNCMVIHRKQQNSQPKSPWSFGFVCSILRNIKEN